MKKCFPKLKYQGGYKTEEQKNWLYKYWNL